MDFKRNSLSNHIQSLWDSDVDFPQKLKHHLVFKSDQVTNPFKFIGGLISRGVLCDGPNDSDGNLGLKEIMVRLATRIVISKGADGICGLIDALEESGNLKLISDIRACVKQSFGIKDQSDFSELKGNDSAAVQAPKLELLAKPTGNATQMSSCGTKLIDKMTSRVEDDFMEQLQGYLVGKASKVLNVARFCSSLVQQDVLDKNEAHLKTGPEGQQSPQIEKVMMAVCSKRAFGSLVLALQSSNNERLLAETYEWLETSSVRKKNYPIAVKSLASQPSTQKSKAVKSTFFEQAALPDELSKLAAFTAQPRSATKGVIGVHFDKERMIACAADGTLNLWNWKGNEKQPTSLLK